jgi:hypothetical protein
MAPLWGRRKRIVAQMSVLAPSCLVFSTAENRTPDMQPVSIPTELPPVPFEDICYGLLLRPRCVAYTSVDGQGL